MWEREVLAQHRWGRHGDMASEELARLRKLWEAAQPVNQSCETIMEQIVALEICNWNLEESILALCTAIGKKEPAKLGIGHMKSMSEERWKKAWAYCLTLRNWLPCEIRSGYETLLKIYDPDKSIQNHVLDLLGERNDLKELYVERLCLCLEFKLGGGYPRVSAQAKVHDVAASAVEEEIKKRDPESSILNAFLFDSEYNTYAGLELCHHKFFRRCDIIISSIGASKWRKAMPMKGTDGFERAATLEKYLSPIESWIESGGKVMEHKEGELFDKIHTLLGKPDDIKLFLASLLVSLLRSQQLHSEKLAKSRVKKS